ncbi:MAG: YdcF family protein [Oscillospiraceae bacterium]|nr:YdcF family protein [Oscillospiraceae bacterium]
MKKYLWAIIAAALLLLAGILRFGAGIHYPAYTLGAVAACLVIWHFRSNLTVLVLILVNAALFLRFALRGYNWWAYALLFVAALLLLHRFLPTLWWRTLLVLVCVGLAYFCYVESFIIKNARTDETPQRDYLIVLGAAVYKDQPSLTLVRRLEGALDYMQTYPESVAILSGGMGPGETVTEAQAMYDWMLAQGVDPGRLIMEPKATSTEENLAFSFSMIRQRGDEPDGHVAIVSSAYHLYRAKQLAALQGVNDAAGVAAPWGYFFVMLNYFIREAFGVTHLWVFGR